jgi:flavin-dependent dehydrogenase
MELDVAIVGGGLAGAALARQLRLRLPSLAIGLFERDDDGGFKVGESTVEIASNYLTRRLGLATYLYENHLPKNGLRFFFDDEAKSQPLEDLGEIGTDALPFHPSFQVDRQRLDRDLRRMNAQGGVHVQTGVKVVDLQPGTGGAAHRFTIEDGERRTLVKARWLVDASGRARMLGRTLGESRTDTGHHLAAAWGRFENVVDMDAHRPGPWRARVRGTSRYLSTNHFCYPGYWIWFIPIARGVVSVGVVCDRALFQDAWRTIPGLVDFVRSHRAAGELLRGAKAIDAMGYTNVAYGGGSFFSADRWARVGEANVFSDPLYSPGSDFIAIENDFTTELVAADVGGATPQMLADRAALFDEFVQFRFDATLHLYRDLYCTLGSYELFSLKWDFDIHSYYNLWYDAYALDKHLDPTALREQLSLRAPVLAQMANFSRLFRTAATALRERGDYFRGNLGVYSHPLRAIDFVADVGRPRPRKQILRAVSAISNVTRARVIALLDDRRTVEPWPLGAFMLERDLVAE